MWTLALLFVGFVIGYLYQSWNFFNKTGKYIDNIKKGDCKKENKYTEQNIRSVLLQFRTNMNDKLLTREDKHIGHTETTKWYEEYMDFNRKE